MRSEYKVRVSVGVVSGVPQDSVLESMLFILHTSELFHIVENHTVGYADDTMIYTVITRPLSCSRVIKSLNQDLKAIYSWCLKRQVRLNLKRLSICWLAGLKLMLRNGLRILRNGLRILGATFDSKLKFQTHLRDVFSKAARSLSVLRRQEG